MNPHDENPPDRHEPDASAPSDVESQPAEPETFPTLASTPEQGESAPEVAGDPISHAAIYSSPEGHWQTGRLLPEDARVSWSWPHFIIFVLFAVSSFIVVQTAFALYYAPHQHLTQKQLEQYFLNKPQFLFGSNLVWYALILLFLYVTLAALPEKPFWRSLGWQKLKSNLSGAKRSPWFYFLCGCGLSVFVFVASSQVHEKENMPIQEVLKNRSSAMLLMAMAVLVAPLVEETVFRGYLYPLFAKWFGITPSIFVTGTLFGLMHGAQLGWTWGIVGLLIFVGIVFTTARAYTGTVVASYLLHLGYNSMIALVTIIGTHGFTKMPLPP